MDVATFCTQSRVLIVAGKGGVGKTTITAALAKMASSAGLHVLVVELEGKPGVPAAFGQPGSLDYHDTVLDDLAREGTVRARRITPDDALIEYLADHGMKRISKRLVSSGALDVVATAIPGIRDILVLGKVKQLERDDPSDLVLVDAPATGHTMTFLSSAKGLLDAARSGPVRAQAAEVVELLSDAERCQVALVTLPEEMPVNEVVESAYQLEDRIGINLGPVIVNGCLPEQPLLDTDPREAAAEAGVTVDDEQAEALGRAAAFRAHRYRLQAEQWERLGRELPLPQLHAPVVFSAHIGPGELEVISAGLAEAVGRLNELPPARALRATARPPGDGRTDGGEDGADDATRAHGTTATEDQATEADGADADRAADGADADRTADGADADRAADGGEAQPRAEDPGDGSRSARDPLTRSAAAPGRVEADRARTDGREAGD